MRANSPANEPNCPQKTYAQQATPSNQPEHRHSCSKFCASADKAESVSSSKGVIDSYEAGRAWWSSSIKLPAKMLPSLQTATKLLFAAPFCRCLERRHLRRPLRRSSKGFTVCEEPLQQLQKKACLHRSLERPLRTAVNLSSSPRRGFSDGS